MKRSHIFKLSTIASLVTVSLGAQASIYNVEMVSTGVTANESYGSAISKSGIIAGDSREGTEGLPFREEAPFGIDNTFFYQDFDDIERYCFRELGYNSCENWATRQWEGINDAGGLEREREAFYWGYTSNAKGFNNGSQIMTSPSSDYVPGGGSFVAGSNNVIVNKFTDDGNVIGTTSSGYYDFDNYGLAYRERGFVGDTILLPRQDGDQIVKDMGRTMAFDSFVYQGSTYIVGSAAVNPFNARDGDKDYDGRDVGQCITSNDPASLAACQNFAFSTKGYVWSSDAPDAGMSVSLWFNTTSDDATTGIRDDRSYMASVRGAVVRDPALNLAEDGEPTETDYDGLPVLVGYNTYRDSNNLLMQAAVFYPNEGFNAITVDAWDTKFISGAEVEDDREEEYVYSNSKATDINNNLLVIGEAKRRGDKPENGAAANRLFVADARTNAPKANYLSDSIFFTGAGGEAKAVNNYNEIVGSVDAETAREDNGKQRRRRGFINPYSFEGTDTARRAMFQNRSWWLDDLTNDDNVDGENNKFRIVEAADINDNGEIAATALYCAEGYDSTGHNAYCGGGTGIEEIVAVKLVPTFDSSYAPVPIIPRSVDLESVERAGSLGPWLLGLLGLVSLRRRR